MGRLDTKIVELGDDFSLRVPTNSTCAWLDEGRWQCGDPDEIFQCYFRHEIAPPSDPPTHPLVHAQRCLDIMRRWLEEHGAIGGIDERRTISGGIMHGITEDTDSGEVHRAARWGIATGFSHGTLFFRMTLSALAENWDHPSVPRLIEHFATQAVAGIGTESLFTEGLGLRDLRIDGPVVVSVPATWSVRQDEDRIIATGADGLPTLIADLSYTDDEAVLRAMSEAGPAQNFAEMAEVGLRAATALARTLAVVVNSIDRSEYGAIIAGEIDAPGAADQQLV